MSELHGGSGKNCTLEIYWKNGENTGKVGEFCQSGKLGTVDLSGFPPGLGKWDNIFQSGNFD